MTLVKAGLHFGLVSMIATAANAQVNGNKAPEPSLPFTMTQVSTFDFPFRIAFLPDSRMLVTEKVGSVWLVKQTGEKTELAGVPQSVKLGNAGMLGVFLSPRYATDHNIYLTYAEPGEGGAGLALARGKLVINGDAATLENVSVIWRAGNKMDISRGNMGAQVTFSPDGKYLFLSVGDQFRMAPAQDPNVPQGKILRLTLDGKPAPGNPGAGKVGTPTMPRYDFPKDTEEALTALKVVGTAALPGPNTTPAEIWALGFRCPYGLAFAPDGRLWEVENGPTGGDELNLIAPGKNYGWPLVSYGVNDGPAKKPIPTPDTRPDLVQPVIYWTPVIAPGSLTFYKGAMFPQWNGNAFVTGLAGKTINRIVFDGKGGATQAERWDTGHRMRDVEVAPDGAIWAIEDDAKGALWRLTPK
jgi:aldose sugar dehydrogenase